jgi:hypothetical protein
VEHAERVYGTRCTCPDGGRYVVSEDGKTVTCSIHGSVLDPRQGSAPAANSATARLMRDFADLTAALTFTKEGLRAVVTIDRKPLSETSTGRKSSPASEPAAKPAAADGNAQSTKAQDSEPQLPPKSYMNKNVFYLPVLIDDSVRARLREIRLYVKDDPAKAWTLAAKGQPWEKVFPFQPPQEGEYWFALVTIDKSGHQTPADLTREGPGVIVVYDASVPQVDIHPLPPTSDGQCVQCEVRNRNLDVTLTRFEYQTGDKIWRQGVPVPGSVDVFCIPRQANHNGMVRVTAGDRAGNTTTCERPLSALRANK